MEDLYWEHEAQHTSEDWAELKNRCSSCYSATRTIRPTCKCELGSSIRQYKVEDLALSPDPRN